MSREPSNAGIMDAVAAPTCSGHRFASSSSSRPLLFAPSRRRRLTIWTTRSRLTANRGEKIEIRVCVNRSCNRLGSREILGVLSDIAPPEVSVNSCGCLGRCGAGPNLVVLPRGALVGHCGTPARAAELLANLCAGAVGGEEGKGFDPWKNLEALSLRKKGEEELLENGNPSQAVELLSQAVDLKPSGGLHRIYQSRSAARLSMGDYVGALEDANEASRIAPSFPQAYICQGDVFMAMKQWDAAEKAYSNALLTDPLIRRSKSFKARVTKLQEKFLAANMSS